MNPDAKRSSTPAKDLSGRDRMGRNVAFAWGGYMVNVVAGFIIPRLISDRLGQTTLGIWDFSWSIVSYFGLVQLGLGGSVNRYVAKYRATGDNDSLSRSVSTIALFQRLVGWLALAIAAATAWWILPLFASKLGGELQASRWVVLFLGVEISVSIMMTVYGSVIVGCHRWDIHNTVSAISYALIAVAMVVVLLCGGGLAALALSHCVFYLAGEVARWRLSRRVCPELVLDSKLASWPMFHEQARYSAKNLVPRVADLVSNQALSVLVTMFLGPASLAIFSRPKGLIGVLRTLAAKFGFIIVPTASTLQAREDLTALRSIMLNGAASMAALALPAIVTLAILGSDIIRVWMGEKYVYPGLVPILALGALAPLIQESVWGVLSGMNIHGRMALAKLGAAICAASSLGVGLALLHWHLIGAAICFSLPTVIVEGVVMPVYACRQLHLAPSAYYWQTLIKPGLCVTPYALALAIARPLFGASAAWALLAFATGGVATLVLYWLFLVPVEWRLRLCAWMPGSSRWLSRSVP